MKGDAMDAVFHALAHPDRRRFLDLVKKQPGVRVNDLLPYFDVSRIAVLKHLRVLEAAGLVHGERAGRERHLYFNAVPIQMIHERWTTEFSRYWSERLTHIKYNVEMRRRKR